MPRKTRVVSMPIDTALGKVLTTPQCAEVLHTSPRTVLRLIQHRRLPATKIGRGYRIREEDLLRLFGVRKGSLR